jgi:hypothetical protein
MAGQRGSKATATGPGSANMPVGERRSPIRQLWRCPAQMIVSMVAPPGLEAAVIIEHAYMRALAPCTKLLCDINCEYDCLLAVRYG